MTAKTITDHAYITLDDQKRFVFLNSSKHMVIASLLSGDMMLLEFFVNGQSYILQRKKLLNETNLIFSCKIEQTVSTCMETCGLIFEPLQLTEVSVPVEVGRCIWYMYVECGFTLK